MHCLWPGNELCSNQSQWTRKITTWTRSVCVYLSVYVSVCALLHSASGEQSHCASHKWTRANISSHHQEPCRPATLTKPSQEKDPWKIKCVVSSSFHFSCQKMPPFWVVISRLTFLYEIWTGQLKSRPDVCHTRVCHPSGPQHCLYSILCWQFCLMHTWGWRPLYFSIFWHKCRASRNRTSHFLICFKIRIIRINQSFPLLVWISSAWTECNVVRTPKAEIPWYLLPLPLLSVHALKVGGVFHARNTVAKKKSNNNVTFLTTFYVHFNCQFKWSQTWSMSRERVQGGYNGWIKKKKTTFSDYLLIAQFKTSRISLILEKIL